MKKLLLLFTVPTLLTATTVPTGHTHLHHHCHYQLHTGPLSGVEHVHNGAAPFLDGSLQVTTFYEYQPQSSKAGRFIGTQATNTQYTLAHLNTQSSVDNKLADATNNLFVHFDPTATNNLNVTFDARPWRQAHGALLAYEQHIPLLNSWYVGARVPVVDARTNLNLKTIDGDNDTPGDLSTYFAGYYHSDTAGRAQDKLMHNRFDVHELQRGGLPHIDLWLRKQILSTKRAAIDLRIHTTIPLIKPAPSTNLYTPTIGSNGHWHLGASANAQLELWNRHHNQMYAGLRGHIGYGLSAEQTRVLGISNALTNHKFGHYALLTNINAAANDALTPGANIFAKKIAVTPGLSYELTGALTWQGARTTFDVGYTYHGHEAEAAGSWQWAEGTYAIAGHKYDTAKTFAAQAATSNSTVTLTDAVGATHTYLQRGDLSVAKALLPSADMHTIWSSLGYHTTLGILPFSLHAGLAGTVAGTGWAARPVSGWVKMRLSF